MAHNDPMCFERDFNPGKEMFLGKGVIFSLLTFSESLCMNIFSCLDNREVCTRMKNSGDLNKLFELSANPNWDKMLSKVCIFFVNTCHIAADVISSAAAFLNRGRNWKSGVRHSNFGLCFHAESLRLKPTFLSYISCRNGTFKKEKQKSQCKNGKGSAPNSEFSYSWGFLFF